MRARYSIRLVDCGQALDGGDSLADMLDLASFGHVAIVDHAPFRIDGPGGTGKDNPRARNSLKWVPNGIPRVETRLQILISEGIMKGRISAERFVELTSTNPDKLYGLYARKGSITIGGDADIVLWNPEATGTIRQENLHHGLDYTPYEGLEVTGIPQQTIPRGKTVARNGDVTGPLGAGHNFSRTLVEEIELVKGLGVKGDAHAGETVKHRSRVKADRNRGDPGRGRYIRPD